MLPQKQWYDSSTADPEQVKQLCSEWKTNPLVAEILLRRGYKTHEEIKSFLKKQIKLSCYAEMDSLKPGNVHKYSSGHGMTAKDFYKSANIIANYLTQNNYHFGKKLSN